MTITKPVWLKQKIQANPKSKAVRGLLTELHLNTVCLEAGCPNRSRCYADGTATFLILGNICTRNCRFCNIRSGNPAPVEADEPERVAKAAKGMSLAHIVVTSVTRDDLPDGGAEHFAATTRSIRKLLPQASVELLIPDFEGNEEALNIVINESPDVLNHNVETVPELYETVRPKADYRRSLELLSRTKNRNLITKSGIMVGLGETKEQISRTMEDLAEVGIDILTIGQYLAPSAEHHPVARYIPPEEFEYFTEEGRRYGIGEVVSGPLVRSSYCAGEAYRRLAITTKTQRTRRTQITKQNGRNPCAQ